MSATETCTRCNGRGCEDCGDIGQVPSETPETGRDALPDSEIEAKPLTPADRLKLNAREQLLLNIEAAAELLVALGEWNDASSGRSSIIRPRADDLDTPKNRAAEVKYILSGRRVQAAVVSLMQAEDKHRDFLADMAKFAGGVR